MGQKQQMWLGDQAVGRSEGEEVQLLGLEGVSSLSLAKLTIEIERYGKRDGELGWVSPDLGQLWEIVSGF